jgi:hypothetical protein
MILPWPSQPQQKRRRRKTHHDDKEKERRRMKTPQEDAKMTEQRSCPGMKMTESQNAPHQ